MDTYHIRGGCPLNGEVVLSGAKNSVLPIFAASVVTGNQSNIINCPDISDAGKMKDILRMLGCSVTGEGNDVFVDSSQITSHTINEELMSSMRSSVFLAGGILARCGIAEIGKPGGCKIGKRPIDIHIETLRALGAEVEEREERLILKAGSLKGSVINLPFPSVGATENAMIAASRAEGETVINNAAREPEIVDLQNFLNQCGAQIKGAGSSRIAIKGVKKMNPAQYEIIPDRIEGGTFLCMAVATKGEILVKNAIPGHMDAILQALESIGCRIRVQEKGVWLKACKNIRGNCSVLTAPFPGFPTDMQPQITAMVAATRATGMIRERIFENRFGYVKELNKMGAGIEIYGKNAIIPKGKCLMGKKLFAEDLRGGAALVTAALAAEGESTVCGVQYIKRGYCRLDEKLRLLGADITEEDDGK